jgi:hypothetical protein
MLRQQLELTNEQTSPLFRIMYIQNVNEPHRRQCENNICAFHIGNGLILSVAHNIKAEAQIFKSIVDSLYTSSILPFLNSAQILFFNKCYPLDTVTGIRNANITEQNDFKIIVDTLKQINFDMRWLTLMRHKIAKPHLIVQFQNNQFYNDEIATGHFNATTYFQEPAINKTTFLIEVELVEAFFKEDIALYRIINTHQDIINKLPSIAVDFSILPDDTLHYYCLQSSPNGFLGRLINKAQIEGYVDHHGTFMDPIGGNYTFEGLRYLIKGYFRFGSSGAPYIFYDKEQKQFKVNAVQSEACPIQLSISNNKDGNFQYVNALASPLSSIEEKLKSYLNLKAV